MAEAIFQLKGSVLTVVVLELVTYDQQALAEGIQDKIDAAPQFFLNSPVLINLSKLNNPQDIPDFAPLLDKLRQLGLRPVGFAAAPEQLHAAIEATGLAVLPSPGERANRLAPPEAKAAPKPAAETVEPAEAASRPSKVITRPIRSGQQVYAEGADLIILSQVSEGAEVLADGHIHVYGALRGRALAGVKGDTDARIFCQSLEAELVSVAGNFFLQDSFDNSLLKKPAHIHLAGESLRMEPL